MVNDVVPAALSRNGNMTETVQAKTHDTATFRIWRGDRDGGRFVDYATPVSEAIARAALERQESRGGHFRDDRPDKDPAYGKFNIVIRKGADGGMQLAREPIPEMPAELKRVIEEQK